jgi:methyl-accepting chemotaxis protein
VSDSPSYRYAGQYVEICRKLEFRGETVGTIALRSDLSEAYARLTNYAQIVGLAFLVSLLVGLLISWGLQRMVSGPILGLAKVARQVITGAELRDPRQTKNRDEIGDQVDGFNEMLRQIEQRNSELKDAQTELQNGDRIAHEVVERRRAEKLAGITIGCSAQRGAEQLPMRPHILGAR